MTMSPGFAQPIREPVDDEPITILQRRFHAEGADTPDLDAEGGDEDRVHTGGRQRLNPGQHVAPNAYVPVLPRRPESRKRDVSGSTVIGLVSP